MHEKPEADGINLSVAHPSVKRDQIDALHCDYTCVVYVLIPVYTFV